MKALRTSLGQPHLTPPPGKGLATMLRPAVTDDYVRRFSKQARYRPKNLGKKSLRHPKLYHITSCVQKELDVFEPVFAA